MKQPQTDNASAGNRHDFLHFVVSPDRVPESCIEVAKSGPSFFFHVTRTRGNMPLQKGIIKFPMQSYFTLMEGLNKLPVWTVHPQHLQDCLEKITAIMQNQYYGYVMICTADL